ncbi:MAG: metal ABC transporter substrate-binding protein, partial [Dehalococcoidia bacterium]|nr:metal ABC transporter substrate-binding protein [Dehalococcoidia bacterium]
MATLNFIEDWVENIGGDRVEVKSLLPIGSYPHTFQPGARAVADIADADLLLTIGLRLEAYWLEELVKNAARDPSTVVELGEVVDPIEFVEIHDAHAEKDEHDEGDADHDHEEGDAHHDHGPP